MVEPEKGSCVPDVRVVPIVPRVGVLTGAGNELCDQDCHLASLDPEGSQQGLEGRKGILRRGVPEVVEEHHLVLLLWGDIQLGGQGLSGTRLGGRSGGGRKGAGAPSHGGQGIHFRWSGS
jgi:hypothetical protein